MNAKVLPYLLFGVGYWLVLTYAYSRYDGDITKYAITEGAMMPARVLAVFAGLKWLKRFEKMQVWYLFPGLLFIAVLAGMLNRVLKFFWLVPTYFKDSTIEFWHWRANYDVFDIILAMGVGLTTWLYVQNKEALRKMADLETEKVKAELSVLKSQLHPHFLFNTLNNIYVLARNHDARTAEVTMRLANLLRFVIYEAESATIPISTEIRIIEDYIGLEQLRFDEERLSIQFEKKIENPDFLISPLLLLPLVENAFKHGAGEQRNQATIHISINQSKGHFEFVIKNSMPENVPVNSINGIGIKNVKRQLELLYPGRSAFVTNKDAGHFIVHLTIDA